LPSLHDRSPRNPASRGPTSAPNPVTVPVSRRIVLDNPRLASPRPDPVSPAINHRCSQDDLASLKTDPASLRPDPVSPAINRRCSQCDPASLKADPANLRPDPVSPAINRRCSQCDPASLKAAPANLRPDRANPPLNRRCNQCDPASLRHVLFSRRCVPSSRRTGPSSLSLRYALNRNPNRDPHHSHSRRVLNPNHSSRCALNRNLSSRCALNRNLSSRRVPNLNRSSRCVLNPNRSLSRDLHRHRSKLVHNLSSKLDRPLKPGPSRRGSRKRSRANPSVIVQPKDPPRGGSFACLKP
jgi:hypothetical protein